MASKKLDVKLFLWGLFLLQIFLISVFLAFGSLLVSNIQQDDLTGSLNQPENAKVGTQPTSWFNVKFISNQTTTSEVADQLEETKSERRVRHPRFKPLQLRTVPKPDNYTKYYR